jgi:hypothetical protein
VRIIPVQRADNYGAVALYLLGHVALHVQEVGGLSPITMSWLCFSARCSTAASEPGQLLLTPINMPWLRSSTRCASYSLFATTSRGCSAEDDGGV